MISSSQHVVGSSYFVHDTAEETVLVGVLLQESGLEYVEILSHVEPRSFSRYSTLMTAGKQLNV